tara:strand:- start:2149 stop:3393 length:1245 start_codon:yes stop_codon:yes gene_type:complete
MAQQLINIGTADAKLGDTLFSAFTKTNTNFTELFAVSTLVKRVVVNTLADLPAAVAGVITLAADTLYVQADDLNLSTTRLVFGANTVYSGIDSLVVTLSYVGTLPLFTMTNVNGSVKDLAVTHLNAPLFSFSDSGSHVLRVSNLSYAGSSIGTLGGSGSSVRFTNFSGATTSTGVAFTGNWRVFLFEPTLSSIASGSFINLGSATFDAISISETTLDYVAGSFYISGALTSGNINAGGFGSVSTANLKGAGTPLQQITPDDALFNFSNNNTIRDSRSDGILSLQGNTVATTIAGPNIPALTAGTWVVGPVGQFTGTTGGRLTYIGGKDARLPITFSASLAPTLSTGIAMSAYVAINGVVVANSRRQGTGSAGGPTSITIPWQHTFSTNDYVEMFVENNSNATDILVSTAIGRVN